MPYISVRQFPHYYEWITASGTPAPSGKPVMVFVHGWGGSSRYWESTARAIAERYDCLLYDLRGFGRSQPGAAIATVAAAASEAAAETALDHELETYADDLAVLLDALEIQQVDLNAHSTGASIAVYFLNCYTDRVRRAILTCNGIFTYNAPAFKAFHLVGGYVVKFRPRWLYKLPLMDRLFMQRFLHRPLPRTVSREFLEDFLLADQAAALGTMFAAVSQKAAELMPQEFARLTVPTLLISGEYDVIIPAAMGQQAATLSPWVKHVVIPKTAHFPMLEDTEAYLKVIRPFLELEQAAIVTS
jgi:proline iminopeptidase